MPKPTGSPIKWQHLINTIKQLGSVVVSYSGGLDSSVLLWSCTLALPYSSIVAVTFASPAVPAGELEAARQTAAYLKIDHVIAKAPEFNNDDFVKNDLLRCYYCKRERSAFLLSSSTSWGKNYIIEGSHQDDLDDYRPGMKALKEYGIISPFIQAGITRAEIENMAWSKGLPFNGQKPEACLATRIKTGQKIKPDVLALIDEAETFIKSRGFGLVRARWDEGAIRLEFDSAEIEKAFLLRETIVPRLKKMGFKNVSLDLEGYKSKSRKEGKIIDG